MSIQALMENGFSFILNVLSPGFVDWGQNELHLAEPLFSWVKSHAVWLGKSSMTMRNIN